MDTGSGQGAITSQAAVPEQATVPGSGTVHWVDGTQGQVRPVKIIRAPGKNEKDGKITGDPPPLEKMKRWKDEKMVPP